MEVGDKVKVKIEIDDTEYYYLGEIVAYENVNSPSTYKVSVAGIGKVMEFEVADIEAI